MGGFWLPGGRLAAGAGSPAVALSALIVFVLAWLPAVAFGLLAISVLVFGVSVLHYTGLNRQAQHRVLPDVSRHLKGAVASGVLATLAIAVIFLGPWSIGELNAFAIEYPLFNVGFQLVWGALIGYPFWVYWNWPTAQHNTDHF